MSRHAYILVFDRDNVRDYQSIHNRIITISGLINWFHYIKSSYILISKDASAKELAKKIQPIIPKKYYIIFEIDMNNRQGWLPSKAWDWIHNQAELINEESD